RMADKSKPFLKKGAGKYTKINYPVLRRSGVYQPIPDSSPRRMQPMQQGERREDRRQLPPPLQYPSSPIARPVPSTPSISIPPLVNRAMETGVMGQRSPSVSDYSRASDSPPRTTAFGSSLERRMGGESDEGMGKELRSNSPGPNSGRPGTVDSGFPREEMPLSPVSSTGDTRASSFPSIDEDVTRINLRENHSEDDILRPLHSPHHTSTTRAAAAVDEDEVVVEPAAAAARPIPARRSSVADRSTIGTTTAEFERRERLALRQEPERRETRPYSPHSSLSSSTSTITRALTKDVRQVVREIGGDHGEASLLFPGRLRRSAVAAAEPTHAANGKEGRGGVGKPQRMIGSRLDSPAGSDASTLSPIHPRGRPASVQEFEGASFHGSADRPGSSSHFRINTTDPENSLAASAVEGRGGRDGKMVDRSVQQPSLQLQQERRRRSEEEEGSEASSGSTTVARRYLLGDRRPLNEVHRRRSSDEITGTQQRPRPQTRASEATLRRQPITIIEESSDGPSEDSEEETFVLQPRGPRVEERRGEGERRGEMREEKRGEGRGRRRGETREEMDREWREIQVEKERVRLMKSQLRDAIAHNDLSGAAFRRESEELHYTFDKKLHELAADYAVKKETLRKMEEEWRDVRDKEKTEQDQKRGQLEKERGLVRKDETAKVKEWRTKCEEAQKKYEEEKKKNGTEISKRRVVEERAKMEAAKAAEKIAKLEKDNDRMKKVMESSQREQAVARGQSAHRFALSRAEDVAAAAPRRNGMQRMIGAGGGGSVNALSADKENYHPCVHSFPPLPPPGILKKNQVRFADTTFTVPPEGDFYMESSGTSSCGPFVMYANPLGKKVRMSILACGGRKFEYNNGNLRYFPADGSHTFHYLASSGLMQWDFIKERSQIYYFPDGQLNILRTGREITKCWNDGETIRRIETMKRPDGSMYTEIWKNNAMEIVDERGMGAFEEQYEIGKKVTERNSWVGRSVVALHSNKDVEFFEQNFYAVYCHGDSRVILAVNMNQPNETRYTIHPGEIGKITHPASKTPECMHFGLRYRWYGDNR
ncbi:hypothetical protein PENTCL1PPCAC_11100, partial [Pristionchus entomophagus]